MGVARGQTGLILRVSFFFLAAAMGTLCSCGDDAAGNGSDGGPDGPGIAGGDLIITPAEVTLDITPGGAAGSQVYMARTKSGTDVSATASWSVDDATLGSFSGSTFTSNTMHGGTAFVRASWQGQTGFATIHVKLHAGTMSDSCPGCPAFPPSNAPPCTATAQTPTVLYPPNGTLVPPNMNVLEIQFDQGT